MLIESTKFTHQLAKPISLNSLDLFRFFDWLFRKSIVILETNG
ncbi:hypothetical protein LEP1GSC050_3201 [Leptospira broomii serovar Hurstbridge str. 5399]|uniref:Uncharacterized protein n=1 Tax=Leptospira broomii serovar Hurstbridge str. 5399 TaxID=1049789 RepID=T0F445_9LEPT|nr:hypothetical protein LEP1GSC050_3201 [Leptospira broomii serovar Hurstbridge str. 5399]